MSASTALLAIKIIDLMMLGMQVAPAVIERHNARKAEIQRLVDAGEDPSDAVHAALDAAIDDLRAQLHAPIKPPTS